MSDTRSGNGFLINLKENCIFKGVFWGDSESGEGEILPMETYDQLKMIDTSLIESIETQIWIYIQDLKNMK